MSGNCWLDTWPEFMSHSTVVGLPVNHCHAPATPQGLLSALATHEDQIWTPSWPLCRVHLDFDNHFLSQGFPRLSSSQPRDNHAAGGRDSPEAIDDGIRSFFV